MSDSSQMAEVGAPPPKLFLRGLLARTTSLLLAGACINYLVNPFGAYATGIFEPIRLGSRLLKLKAYAERRPRPAIVILGSSRSFTMEPAYIEAKTLRPAFNAAVAAAGPRDYVALASCFANEGGLPPVLIVGLGVEQLLGAAQLVEHPDPLARCLGAEQDWPLGSLRSYRGLFTIEESWASWRVLGFELVGRPAPAYTFAPDGLVRTTHVRPWREALDESLAGNWNPTMFDIDRLNPQPLARMRYLLEISRLRGSRVVVYLPPYHPKAIARYVSESHFVALREMVLSQLAEWAKQYPLKYHDFTEAKDFGASEEMFLDASHPGEAACRLMLDAMLGELR